MRWLVLLALCFGGAELRAAEPVTIQIFTATWCGSCPRMHKVGEQLQAEGWNVKFIDVDARPKWSQREQIGALPTTLVKHGTRELDRLVGAVPKETVLRRVSR